MSKIGQVAVVVAMVVMVYIIMLVTHPVIVGLCNSANVSMAATSNMSALPGSQSFMLVIPWILWFVPASIGLIIVIVILRRP